MLNAGDLCSTMCRKHPIKEVTVGILLVSPLTKKILYLLSVHKAKVLANLCTA